MKMPISFVCLSLIGYSAFCFGADDNLEETVPVEEDALHEVALLEPRFLTQQSIEEQELALDSIALPSPRKSSFWAVSLSSLVPGLGHVYLGDLGTAGTLFGSSTLFNGLNSFRVNGKPLVDEQWEGINGLMAQNTWFYNIYAIYRDVRAYNNEEGYWYKMPNESLLDLVSAPFQWRVLKKPEVWGGFLGAMGLAIGMSFFMTEETECRLDLSPWDSFPLLAFPVGIGEEAFFRGYLQSFFSEMLTPISGMILSSIAFGAVHIFNTIGWDKKEKRQYYTFSLPLITCFGAYFGWLTYKNRSLKESVAVHSWYDFALFLISYSVANSAAIRKPSLSFSISF